MSGLSPHRRDSIGVGATFLPLERTMSAFLRSVMKSQPSESMLPMSPECIQPSGSRNAAVSSGSSL